MDGWMDGGGGLEVYIGYREEKRERGKRQEEGIK